MGRRAGVVMTPFRRDPSEVCNRSGRSRLAGLGTCRRQGTLATQQGGTVQRLIAAAVTCCLLAAATVAGQEQTGSVQGVVRDVQGGVLPGAVGDGLERERPRAGDRDGRGRRVSISRAAARPVPDGRPARRVRHGEGRRCRARARCAVDDRPDAPARRHRRAGRGRGRLAAPRDHAGDACDELLERGVRAAAPRSRLHVGRGATRPARTTSGRRAASPSTDRPAPRTA